MDTQLAVRLDKWLWCVRLYKSRSLAAKACLKGEVQIGGRSVKPSRLVKPGDVITALVDQITRKLKVLGLPQTRTSAPLVQEFLQDLTPPEAYEKRRHSSDSDHKFDPDFLLGSHSKPRARIGTVYKGWN
jgi:ribosomal 50S subunit-recycling heat shock protein